MRKGMIRIGAGYVLSVILALGMMCACQKDGGGVREEPAVGTEESAGPEETSVPETEESAEPEETSAPETEESTGTEKTSVPETEESTEPEEDAPVYPDFSDDQAVREFLSAKDFLDHLPIAPLSGVKEDGGNARLELGANIQGGCTDGTYFYQAVHFPVKRTDGRLSDILYKIDMSTWEVAAKSEYLPLDHANGITYNGKLHQLVVAHMTGSDGAAADISFVDPDTLELIETRRLDVGISEIAYNETRDQYVVRRNNPYGFLILDADFRIVSTYDGNGIGLGLQSLDCDDDYIYIGDTGVTGKYGTEAVKIYDWDGKLKGIFRIAEEIRGDAVSCSEHEALFHADGQYYVTLFAGGCQVFRVAYDWELLR